MNTTNNHYEQIANSVINKIYPYLVNDLHIYYKDSFQNKDILEIGTGPGFILKELLKEDFNKVYGIDISLDMLLRAHKRNVSATNLNLINTSVEIMPIKDNSLDIIISRGSMFFWENMEKSLSNIYRVLKTNGFALLGGGYGLSTPEEVISEIHDYYKKVGKNSSIPKIDIDSTLDLMNSIGGKAEVYFKPKHGFWLSWRK